jgi:uncharacterized protein
MLEIGFSIYASSGSELNTRILEKVWDADFSYAFTSLHIPEEATPEMREVQHDLLQSLRDLNVEVIADIGPRTLHDLKMTSFQELKQYPITHLRVDYGFSIAEIAKIAQDFIIVLNPSTFATEDFFELLKLGVPHDRLVACHNFYPKQLTGLSMRKVAESNRFFKYNGIKTMVFIAGDGLKRGPIFEGLPTVEELRNVAPLEAALILHDQTFSDVVLVGDIDLSDESWEQLIALSHGYVTLPCTLDEEYSELYSKISHDRQDSSTAVIRTQESRIYASLGKWVAPLGAVDIASGSILIGNKNYARYSGELEIARIALPDEPRKNKIGKVAASALGLLAYIHSGMGFMLVEELDN